LTKADIDDVVDRCHEVRGNFDLDDLGEIARADSGEPKGALDVTALRRRRSLGP
jgi:hypothetical protein